jgi:hypothetical protein
VIVVRFIEFSPSFGLSNLRVRGPEHIGRMPYSWDTCDGEPNTKRTIAVVGSFSLNTRRYGAGSWHLIDMPLRPKRPPAARWHRAGFARP